MTGTRYRIRPAQVEARPFTVATMYEVLAWIREHGGKATEAANQHGPILIVQTLTGNEPLHPGDWIIRGPYNNFYTCKPDVFAAMYEPTDRAAVAETSLSPDYAHPECGFHWHGRDGMDIPMRDGQPVCPRCELRTLERRLQICERRRDELREESLRRGSTVLEYSEKNRALEREIDGVRRQLGAEILRANQAETELRQLAGENPAAEVPQ